MNVLNLVSLAGVAVLMAVGWVFSSNHRRVNWRLVAMGVVLQMVIGLLLFTVPWGTKVFAALNSGVVRVLDCAAEGTRFVFGPLALAPGQQDPAGQESLGFILAFQALPTICFFAALIAILYHIGLMGRLISGFAWVFTRWLRVSGAEAVVAASNIFVGVESALTIRPYLSRLTTSELCTVLTCGMATVASNVLALYVLSLRQTFPQIAGHLISASVLSAPAALIMSKLLVPEDDHPVTLGLHVRPEIPTETGLFEAVIEATQAAVRMIVGIAALLIAVLGLVALVNLLLGACGRAVHTVLPVSGSWSLQGLFGWLFYPLTLCLGVPPSEAGLVARLIGERWVVTEVVAYQDLAAALAREQLSLRSAVITTYALCGFAHIPSMSIFVGGLCALAPNQKGPIGRVAVRALVAATLACLMTACVAGVFFRDGSLLFSAAR